MTRNIEKLKKISLTRLAWFVIVLWLILFIPAKTLLFWQAWIYCTIYTIILLLMTFYFLKIDPALIERRLPLGPMAEKEKKQKVIQSISFLLLITLYIISGFDFQFHWSNVPISIIAIANILFISGFIIITMSFRENTYASSIVEIAKGQKVVSSGLYGIVRHPMYLGGVFYIISTPLALGSFWALLNSLGVLIVIVLRILHEEKLLIEKLDGYKEYCKKTKYRLIPFIW